MHNAKIICLSLFILFIFPSFSEEVNDVWDRILNKKAGEIISISCSECENGMGSISRGKGIYDLGHETQSIELLQGMQINCLDIILVEKGAEIVIKANNGEEIKITGPKMAELMGVQQNAYLGRDMGEYKDLACISRHGNDISQGFMKGIGDFFSGIWNKIKEILAGESFEAKQDTAGAGVRG